MKNIIEPSILTANTYFWNSANNASSRINNEKKHKHTVENFLKQIGFVIIENDEKVFAKLKELEVKFYYSESCKNVYKSLEIWKNGKKSNITSLRKLY